MKRLHAIGLLAAGVLLLAGALAWAALPGTAPASSGKALGSKGVTPSAGR